MNPETVKKMQSYKYNYYWLRIMQITYIAVLLITFSLSLFNITLINEGKQYQIHNSYLTDNEFQSEHWFYRVFILYGSSPRMFDSNNLI